MNMNITSSLRLALFTTGIFIASSCSTINNIEEMSPPKYYQLKIKIASIAELASGRISQNWSDERKDRALVIINDGVALINDPSKLKQLDVTNLIRALGDRYGDKMNLDAQAKSDIREATLLIDILIGPIQLDVTSELSEREKGLLLTLLSGLENGLLR